MGQVQVPGAGTATDHGLRGIELEWNSPRQLFVVVVVVDKKPVWLATGTRRRCVAARTEARGSRSWRRQTVATKRVGRATAGSTPSQPPAAATLASAAALEPAPATSSAPQSCHNSSSAFCCFQRRRRCHPSSWTPPPPPHHHHYHHHCITHQQRLLDHVIYAGMPERECLPCLREHDDSHMGSTQDGKLTCLFDEPYWGAWRSTPDAHLDSLFFWSRSLLSPHHWCIWSSLDTYVAMYIKLPKITNFSWITILSNPFRKSKMFCHHNLIMSNLSSF